MGVTWGKKAGRMDRTGLPLKNSRIIPSVFHVYAVKNRAFNRHIKYPFV